MRFRTVRSSSLMFSSSIAMSSVHRLHFNFEKAFSVAIFINLSVFKSYIAQLKFHSARSKDF